MADNCTHDCSTCSSACSNEGEKKDFFDRVETMVDEFEKEEVQEMLMKISQELEKESAEEKKC